MAILEELAEMGMEMASAVARSAEKNPEKAAELNRTSNRLIVEAKKALILRRRLARDIVEKPEGPMVPKDYVAPPTSQMLH
jgi:ribosomal protein L17